MAALLVSTKWDIGDSGTGNLINKFKEKTLQSAELSEIHCTVLDVKVEEHQREDAARHGVNLIPATPWSDKPTLTWLEYPEVHYPELGKLTNIQHVISYGTDTKKAASAIKARLFPEAKLYLLPSPDQPVAALFVYDVWNKDDYGLAGFHRNVVHEFCERKAKTGESVKAYCTVLDVEINDDQKIDAKSCGVTLIPAKRKEGVEAKDDPMKLEWLFNHEIYYPDLGKLENIQYVVGYAPKTGTAAIDFRRRLFPGATLVLINHVSPEKNCLQTEIFGSAELEEKMLRMAREADQLFSIGPAIHSYFLNAYRAEFQGKELSEIPHEEILPQAMECFRKKTPKLQVSKGPQRHTILTYGEPSAIEKCSGIAGSIGTVADKLPNTHLKWKIQGVSHDANHNELVDKIKTDRISPILHSGYSAGELLVSLQQSHLCIPAPVYMDYGFNGLEAVVFGLPTVLTYYSELAYFIRTHFGIYEDNWVVSTHEEESLKKKILKHLVDTKQAFNNAKALKEALLNSEVVPESYAKFASMLTMPVGKYGEEDGKIVKKAGKITATGDKDDKPQLRDQSKAQPLPEHGNIFPETGTEETSERDEKERIAKSTYSETGNHEMKQNCTPRPDDLPVRFELDDDSFHQTLKVLDEHSKADFHQLGHIKEKQNAVEAVRRDCQMKLTQRSEVLVDDEQSNQEMENTLKEKLGDHVDVNSFRADSLGILLRFLTLYNLYRLKQTCRSRSLAKAFEPLLITDEMREIAANVGVAPLRLKLTYDQKKFREIELFFINRDGGGPGPLESYDDFIDEVIIEDNEWDVPDNHDHQPMGDTAMTDVVQSIASKMLLLEIDPKLEMKQSTETDVRSLLNPVKLTRQRGKQYDILQVVMAMTDRVRDILTSKLEILALLGFVKYLLTVVADKDETQSFPELEKQLILYGKPIQPIGAASETLSLQARGLVPFQIGKRQLTDSDIRYLALVKSEVQSVHSQCNIEKSKILAAKEILGNQLAEALQEKSQLEMRCKELLQKIEGNDKVIIAQHTDYLILKDKLGKLGPNIKDLQSRLDQKDEFISELMKKLRKLSNAQSNVELKKTIAEALKLGKEFISAKAPWEGESIFGDITKPPTEMGTTSIFMQDSEKSTADDTQQLQPTIFGQQEIAETEKTTPEMSGPVEGESTELGDEETATDKTKQVKGNWSRLTLEGQGPYPGQKFNKPRGVTFHDDRLLVCDRNNNIVQILNQDYTCEKVLGSFSGHFDKPFKPLSIAVSQDNHNFILDDKNLQIVVCDQNNKIIRIITLPANVKPWCIALLKGFILVTDVKGHRLLKYTKSGQYVAELGGLGLGEAQFRYPYFVAVNSRDVIIVSDNGNHCIKCFDSEFNYLYQYGQYGNGDGQLYYPFSIAIDDADNVYVCDNDNDRISMWSTDGMWKCHLFQREVIRPSYIAASRDRICVRGRDDQDISVFSKQRETPR